MSESGQGRPDLSQARSRSKGPLSDQVADARNRAANVAVGSTAAARHLPCRHEPEGFHLLSFDTNVASDTGPSSVARNFATAVAVLVSAPVGIWPGSPSAS